MDGWLAGLLVGLLVGWLVGCWLFGVVFLFVFALLYSAIDNHKPVMSSSILGMPMLWLLHGYTSICTLEGNVANAISR
jgi:hypothetical protein